MITFRCLEISKNSAIICIFPPLHVCALPFSTEVHLIYKFLIISMVGISWGRKGMMYLPSINSHSSDTQSFQGSRITFWWTIDNCRFWSSENVCYRKRSDFNWNKIFRKHWPDCIYIFKDGNIEERSTVLRIYLKHPLTLGMAQKGGVGIQVLPSKIR